LADLLWDASALVKRFVPEQGSSTVDALITLATVKHVTTLLAYVEAAAILRRKLNQGTLVNSEFRSARAALRREVLASAAFQRMSADDETILAAITYVDRHNVNSSDGVLLAAFLRYARGTLSPCVLIASDRRLLRAAAAEGLETLNPEAIPPADVPAFLAAL
jgi:predicted nucleic acid-binding protein